MRQVTVTMPKRAKVEKLPKRWLSAAEAQAYIGMGPDFFKRLRQEAKLHFYLIGKSYFYTVEDIDKLITSNKVI